MCIYIHIYIIYMIWDICDAQLPLTIDKNPHVLCTNAGGERRRGGHLRQRRLGLQDRGLALAPGRRQGGHGGAGHGGAMAELGGSLWILKMLEKSLLVGGFKHEFYFHFIYGMSSFPLTNIFSRWLKPPTGLVTIIIMVNNGI